MALSTLQTAAFGGITLKWPSLCGAIGAAAAAYFGSGSTASIKEDALNKANDYLADGECCVK